LHYAYGKTPLIQNYKLFEIFKGDLNMHNLVEIFNKLLPVIKTDESTNLDHEMILFDFIRIVKMTVLVIIQNLVYQIKHLKEFGVIPNKTVKKTGIYNGDKPKKSTSLKPKAIKKETKEEEEKEIVMNPPTTDAELSNFNLK
jgi:hypothetical protein